MSIYMVIISVSVAIMVMISIMIAYRELVNMYRHNTKVVLVINTIMLIFILMSFWIMLSIR